jgi:RimJ/RimL family protein N-acetyltransferase
VTVAILPYAATDFGLLSAANSAAMTEHLGGPESPEKLAHRHRRYLAETGMFRIEFDDQPAGIVGYWGREWNGEAVCEAGWLVLPEFQGRGIAVAAVRLVLHEVTRTRVHAFPSVAHVVSNAVARKAGFELVGECEFEYPPGRWMRCNDWRIDVSR